MTPEKIKEKINKIVQKITPDISEQIILDARKKAYQTKKEKTRSFSWKPALIFAMSCLLFVTVIVNKPATPVVAATISLDINPSIEITLDENDKIIEIIGKNEEGISVVEDLDLEGYQVEAALKVLIESLLKHGFLNENANSILVTVDDEDITDSLMKMINDILVEDNFDGSVVCQNLKDNPDLVKLAETYGISIGRAQLITELIALDETYNIEELAKLNVTQLNLLLGNPENAIPGIKRMGQASQKDYIGEEKAKEIALSSVGAKETEISDYNIEIDYRHRNIVYVIKFVYNNIEYVVMVNGTSGTILECEQENKQYKYQYGYNNSSGLDDENSGNNNYGQGGSNNGTNGGKGNNSYGNGSCIGQKNVKRIAINRANASEYNNYRSELSLQDGKRVYCVEFEANNRQYKYVIDANTGEILEEK